MARIKFLDVLEETKTHSSQIPVADNYVQERDFSEVPSRFSQKHFEKLEQPIQKNNEEKRKPRRENTVEPRLAYGGRFAASETPSKSLEDNRTLWTGALFVFFGGMLFLSGYWLGKSVTSSVKQESLNILNEAAQEFHREELTTHNVSNLPVISSEEPVLPVPVQNTPVVSEPKPVAPKVTPKPVAPKPVAPTQEYVIQVSTHSTISAARQVEDSLRASGFSAYTSENTVGDAVYFRVRLRGFTSKSDADKVLSEIKALGQGSDGYILTLD